MRVIQRTVVLVFVVTHNCTFLDRTFVAHFETFFTLEDPESEKYICSKRPKKLPKSKSWINPYYSHVSVYLMLPQGLYLGLLTLTFSIVFLSILNRLSMIDR